MADAHTHTETNSIAPRHRLPARLLVAVATGLTAALLVPAVVVYACVGLVALSASPSSVQPGGTFTLKGMDFVPSAPLQIHLDSIDGPVIATVTQMTGSVMTSRFSQTVTLPSNVSTGQHVLIGTQNQHNMNGGNPARAALYVGVPAGGPATPASRPASISIDTGPGWVVLAIIALAAAVAGLIVFGAFALRPRRGSPARTA